MIPYNPPPTDGMPIGYGQQHKMQTRDWWNWDTNCKAASLILQGLMKYYSDELSREKFECIMVGAGVRVLSQNTSIFEKIMNTIHQKAPPSSKICFNTNPGDSAEAVLRWVSN